MPEAGKLVRDRIPAIIEEAGERPATRRLAPEERLPALLAKLREETEELCTALDTDHQTEELADVYEVVLAIASHVGVAWSDIERVADRKRADRGGFTEGVWLELSAPRDPLLE